MEVLFKDGDKLVVAAVRRVELSIAPKKVEMEVTLADGTILDKPPVRFDGEGISGTLNHMLDAEAGLDALEFVARATQDEEAIAHVAQVRKVMEIAKKFKAGLITEDEARAESNPFMNFMNDLDLGD